MTLMILVSLSAIFAAFHIVIDNLSLVQIRLRLGFPLLHILSLAPLLYFYLGGQLSALLFLLEAACCFAENHWRGPQVFVLLF